MSPEHELPDAMRILALDTATPVTSVALVDSTADLAFARHDDPGPGGRPNHATALLGLVHAVLAAAGVGWPEIDLVAVGVGPGTFTGLRIGVATAQGLATAAGVGLVPVSSLAALAAAAAPAGARVGRPVLACIDARRGEVFVGGPGIAPAALAPARLGAVASGRLAVGNGALLFRDELEAAGATLPAEPGSLHRVDASWIGRLAVGAGPLTPAQVLPEYVRRPDAEGSTPGP